MLFFQTCNLYQSFTKKLFEGVINLHYMSAKVRPNFCGGSLAGGGVAIEDTMHLLIGEGGLEWKPLVSG